MTDLEFVALALAFPAAAFVCVMIVRWRQRVRARKASAPQSGGETGEDKGGGHAA